MPTQTTHLALLQRLQRADLGDRAVISIVVANPDGMLQVEPLIMKHLFWVGTPTVESVSLADPEVVRVREAMRDCLRAATTLLGGGYRYKSNAVGPIA